MRGKKKRGKIKGKRVKREKKVSKGLKIVVFIVFFVSMILFFISLAGILLDGSLDTRRYYASVIVGDRGGFDLNDSALTFGAIASGGSSTRNVIFKNNYEFEVIVYITSVGNISALLSHEQGIVIGSGEEKKIGISAGIPLDFERGFYDGEVLFSVRKYIS